MPGLAIAGLLPNPFGSDYDLEAVRLTNNANQSIDLRDYNLIDRSGRMWTLTGSIAPNQTTTIIRHGMPMSLNNDGDEIRLVSNGTTIDTLQYDSSTEGAWITR